MAGPSGRKSQALQLVLTLLLGPIGLLYSSPVGGISLFFAAVAVALVTGGYGALLAWPISIVIGVFTVRGRNRRPAAPAAEATPDQTQDAAARAQWEDEGGHFTRSLREARG